MIDFVDNLISSGMDLARAAIVLIAVVTVASVWWRTKALVPVVSSLLVAAIVIWGTSPAGVAWLKGRIDQDTTSLGVVSVPIHG